MLDSRHGVPIDGAGRQLARQIAAAPLTRKQNRYAVKRACELSCSQESLRLYPHV